jgi:hypothetical protein
MKLQATTVAVSVENSLKVWNMQEQDATGCLQEPVRTSVMPRVRVKKKLRETRYDVSSLSCVFVSKKTVRTAQRFTCSVCGKEELLGKTCKAMIRVDFVETQGEVLCHRCADVVIDIMRYGQVVIGNAFSWNLRSRMTGMAAVFDDIQCGKCLQRSMTHVVAKFNGLEKDGVVRRKAVKCCGKCFMTFAYGVRATRLYEEKLEYVPQIFESKRVRS